VIGIIIAFRDIALSNAMGKPEALAVGIAQALVTTASGLVIAIPAQAAYFWFRARIDRFRKLVEETGEQVFTVHSGRSAIVAAGPPTPMPPGRPARSPTRSRSWPRWRREAARDDEDEPAINLTPMIDVVFTLLVFFMLATTFAERERQLDIDLPAANAASTPTPTQELVINVSRWRTGQHRRSGPAGRRAPRLPRAAPRNARPGSRSPCAAIGRACTTRSCRC
jgi:hypothetical protein